MTTVSDRLPERLRAPLGSLRIIIVDNAGEYAIRDVPTAKLEAAYSPEVILGMEAQLAGQELFRPRRR